MDLLRRVGVVLIDELDDSVNALSGLIVDLRVYRRGIHIGIYLKLRSKYSDELIHCQFHQELFLLVYAFILLSKI